MSLGGYFAVKSRVAIGEKQSYGGEILAEREFANFLGRNAAILVQKRLTTYAISCNKSWDNIYTPKNEKK